MGRGSKRPKPKRIESSSEKKIKDEATIVSAIMNLVKECEDDTVDIRTQWRNNFAQLTNGSVFEDKLDWQSNFSANPWEADVRKAHGRLVKILIDSPEWYSLDPRNPDNARASELNPALAAFFDFYLDKSRFTHHASRFILSALLGMGVFSIGWKPHLIMNPNYVIEKAKALRKLQAKKLSKKVENPDASSDSASEIQEKIQRALESLPSLMAGEEIVEEKAPEVKPFIQAGGLDIQVPNNEFFYWDSNVEFMPDSKWNACKTFLNTYEVRELAELGYLNSNGLNIKNDFTNSRESFRKSRAYRGVNESRVRGKVELLYYYGPLIVDDKVKKDLIFAIIGNGSTLLKYTEYPFWEPPGQKTAILACSVRQIPNRATGAGLGDKGVTLSRQYDSNLQLVCDQARLGVAGLNFVDRTALIEPDALEEGIEPGKYIHTRKNPREVVFHADLATNIEQRILPVQSAIREAIQEQTGIQPGGPQPHSRTSAAEIRQQASATMDHVDMIAIDIEQGFLVGALEKMFARVIQFGLDELHTNPEIKSVLSEEHFQLLESITEQERVEILSQFYKFKIKGFSGKQEKGDQLARYNEFLTVVGGNPIFAGVVNPVKLVQNYMRLAELDDDDILIQPNSEYRKIVSENEVLSTNHFIEPDPNDDHEAHIKGHQPLLAGPMSTEAAQVHQQLHMQMLQAMRGPPVQNNPQIQ